jgi:MFS family permease
MLIMAPAIPLAFHAGMGLLVPMLMIVGFVAAFVPTGALAAVPDLAPDPRLSGMAMAIVQIGQNVGMLLGPLTVGSLVGAAGWQIAILALAPISLLGALAAWATRMR